MVQQYGPAMDADDVAFCQAYFRKEGRDPTITELRMIDTYWSDHCRHTTFGTILDEVVPGSETLEKAYARYLAMRKEVYAGGREKPICLMDMGTMGGRYLKKGRPEGPGRIRRDKCLQRENQCGQQRKAGALAAFVQK